MGAYLSPPAKKSLTSRVSSKDCQTTDTLEISLILPHALPHGLLLPSIPAILAPQDWTSPHGDIYPQL